MENSSLHARKIVKKCVLYLLLLLFAFMMLYPIALLINMSLKASVDYYSDPIGWVKPGSITGENYKTVLEKLNFVSFVQHRLILIVLYVLNAESK